MTDPYLTITSAGGTISSNEISTTGTGVEVKAGVTGLGLPSVALQFDESAGDGARYRGRRVLQRSLDMQFHIFGPNRAALKPLVARVSKVLAHPCTVTWHDPDAGEAWTILGYRSGGGDYAYGERDDEEGTDGESFVNIVVTLQTERPYWESTSVDGSAIAAAGTLMVTNTGTVSTPPTWTIKGPSLGFKAVSRAGEVLWFQGLIDNGTTVTIDCNEGTVTDNWGNNRYGDLASLPRMFHLPPGDSSVAITLDQLSSEYADAFNVPRKNHVTNPSFNLGLAGWTTTGYSWDGANKRAVQSGGQTDTRPEMVTTCTGLTIGKNYTVFLDGESESGEYGANAAFRALNIEVLDNGVVKRFYLDPKKPLVDQHFTFTADSTSVTLTLHPECAKKKTDKFARSSGWFDKVFLGEPGPFFDGDTLDTAGMNYAWSGTANASVSTATPVALPSAGTTANISWRSRIEAVI